MNNFSLLAANRLTHLKVVAVALVFSTLVVGIGLLRYADRLRRPR
jgi:Na+/H+-dicarboxylate symporter